MGLPKKAFTFTYLKKSLMSFVQTETAGFQLQFLSMLLYKYASKRKSKN